MNYLHLLSTSLFILLNLSFTAQNLVTNPGFEDMTHCPKELTNNHQTSLRECRGWVNAHQGSCDYFNQCMLENNVQLTSLPHIGKFPEARTGKGLIGFVAYIDSPDANMKSYREFPMTQLKEPLKKGVEYYIEFYLKLSSGSFLYSSGMELVFISDLFLLDRTKKNDEVLVPFLRDGFMRRVSLKGEFSKPNEWMRASTIYVASGRETMFFIGNADKLLCGLQPRKRLDTLYDEANPPLLYAYYFVDDVTIEDRMTAFCKENMVPNKRFVLRNLQFETNRSEIHPSSFPDLDKLVEYLHEIPEINLDIVGHTDMVGDKTYNMKLSFERAKEVKNYLMMHQISGERIKAMGMGSSRPLASNATDVGRALNRRVEVIIR